MMCASKPLLLPALFLVAGCTGGRAISVDGRDAGTFDRMIHEVRGAQVVFVGEFHDQREHHELQLRVIRALQQESSPLAIGLEMFDMEGQPTLDSWVRGEMGLEDFIARYQQEWSISWAEYDSILLFARNRRIPLVALNAPDDIVTKVSHGGFASLRPGDRTRLPSGVTGTTGSSYRSFLREAFAGHMLDDAAFTSFCEAQGVRNNTMQSIIRGYLASKPGSRVVVITGIGHAMRRAVADDLEKAGVTTRVIIPVVEGLVDMINRDDADYFVYP